MTRPTASHIVDETDTITNIERDLMIKLHTDIHNLIIRDFDIMITHLPKTRVANMMFSALAFTVLALEDTWGYHGQFKDYFEAARVIIQEENKCPPT